MGKILGACYVGSILQGSLREVRAHYCRLLSARAHTHKSRGLKHLSKTISDMLKYPFFFPICSGRLRSKVAKGISLSQL